MSSKIAKKIKAMVSEQKKKTGELLSVIGNAKRDEIDKSLIRL